MRLGSFFPKQSFKDIAIFHPVALAVTSSEFFLYFIDGEKRTKLCSGKFYRPDCKCCNHFCSYFTGWNRFTWTDANVYEMREHTLTPYL